MVKNCSFKHIKWIQRKNTTTEALSNKRHSLSRENNNNELHSNYHPISDKFPSSAPVHPDQFRTEASQRSFLEKPHMGTVKSLLQALLQAL